jgi:hypothetical protein
MDSTGDKPRRSLTKDLHKTVEAVREMHERYPFTRTESSAGRMAREARQKRRK